jgi:hypothetical protein
MYKFKAKKLKYVSKEEIKELNKINIKPCPFCGSYVRVSSNCSEPINVEGQDTDYVLAYIKIACEKYCFTAKRFFNSTYKLKNKAEAIKQGIEIANKRVEKEDWLNDYEQYRKSKTL